MLSHVLSEGLHPQHVEDRQNFGGRNAGRWHIGRRDIYTHESTTGVDRHGSLRWQRFGRRSRIPREKLYLAKHSNHFPEDSEGSIMMASVVKSRQIKTVTSPQAVSQIPASKVGFV